MIESGISLLMLVILMVLGVPVCFAFAVPVLYLIFTWGYDPLFLLPYSYARMSSLLLLSIPLFIIAGGVMEKGNITQPLIDFVNVFVGKFKGGLGAAACVANGIFGAISGSAGAALCCIGSIMIPRLVEEGYPRGYAASLISAASGLSLLIPPSITVIIYCWVTNTSVSAVFLATTLPGILLCIMLIIINRIAVRGYEKVKEAEKWEDFGKTIKQIASSGWHALAALTMPVVILGVIYGGVATPTEAAAISVVYALPVGFFVYRGLTRKNLFDSLVESGITTGSIMIMMFFAMMMGRMFAEENIPNQVTALVLNVSSNKYVVLLLINILLFVFGMFVDDISGFLLLAPLLLPVVKAIGISPVHFGAIMCINLTMGLLTPPMAPLLYMGQRIGKVPFSEMLKPSLAFIFYGYLFVTLITTYFPPIAEWLPRVILGSRVLLPG